MFHFALNNCTNSDRLIGLEYKKVVLPYSVTSSGNLLAVKIRHLYVITILYSETKY